MVRAWAEQATMAGGMILDADASRKNFRTPSQRRFLERITGCIESASGCVEAELERKGAALRSTLLVKSAFSAPELQKALSELAAAGKVFLSGNWAASTAWWNSLRQRASDAIAAEHRAHPERAGLL